MGQCFILAILSEYISIFFESKKDRNVLTEGNPMIIPKLNIGNIKNN